MMEKSSITKSNFDNYVSVIKHLCNFTIPSLTICLESFWDHKLIQSFIDEVNAR